MGGGEGGIGRKEGQLGNIRMQYTVHHSWSEATDISTLIIISVLTPGPFLSTSTGCTEKLRSPYFVFSFYCFPFMQLPWSQLTRSFLSTYSTSRSRLPQQVLASLRWWLRHCSGLRPGIVWASFLNTLVLLLLSPLSKRGRWAIRNSKYLASSAAVHLPMLSISCLGLWEVYLGKWSESLELIFSYFATWVIN